MQYKRIITIVLDSVGVGAQFDAFKYNDENTDTLGHTAKAVGGISIKNMEKIGIGNLHPIMGVKVVKEPIGYYTKLNELSTGKDTMTGHWEIMGLKISTPFITFTDTGFPKELIDRLVKETGHEILGNYAASGTEIIDELGEEHIKSGKMIVYTSADSVLQIAAHEEHFGLDELYRCCEIARKITLEDQWKLGRVIARPFIGEKRGEFKRTSNRHDYALKPYGRTVLDELKDNGYDVISVGKISDIFDTEGITESHKSKSSDHGMKQTIELLDKDFTGLLFTNLVDFDALWGHRRNPIGYAKELEIFDKNLGILLPKLNDDDLLIICADHGNDPTHTGTDHTREMIPLLFYSSSFKGSGLLPTSDTFASIGQTIIDNFKLSYKSEGISYLDYLK